MLLAAGLAVAPVQAASVGAAAAEEVLEEEVSVSEAASSGEQSWGEQEDTSETKLSSSAGQGSGADDSVSLIEDSSGNSVDSSLPAGLDIASQIAASQEGSDPIVTVDASQYPAANFGENAREVYWFCRLELGLNHAAACGVLANVHLESSFRPLALGDGGTSYGICQWHLGRCTALMNFCTVRGLDYNTLEGQLYYLQYEFEHGYTACYNGLLSVPDTAEGAARAGYLMCVLFEIPDQTEARGRQRGNLAMNNYYGLDFFETAVFAAKEDTLKVYAQANEDSRVIAELEEGETVRIRGLENGWAKILSVKSGLLQEGYVQAAQLQHIPEEEPLTEEEEETETEIETETEADTEAEAGTDAEEADGELTAGAAEEEAEALTGQTALTGIAAEDAEPAAEAVTGDGEDAGEEADEDTGVMQ